MPNRWRDWQRQAEHDLEQAEASRRDGRHDWACFAAHQGAEKVLKALHLKLRQEAWGHVVARLIEALPDDLAAPGELVEKARALDLFYIPTRYPNGHPAGAPFEHFGPLQSEQALGYARDILDFARPHRAG